MIILERIVSGGPSRARSAGERGGVSSSCVVDACEDEVLFHDRNAYKLGAEHWATDDGYLAKMPSRSMPLKWVNSLMHRMRLLRNG